VYRARSPYRHPNKLSFQVETAILKIKRERRSWGCAQDPGETDQGGLP
jgi:hypothetical protein